MITYRFVLACKKLCHLLRKPVCRRFFLHGKMCFCTCVFRCYQNALCENLRRHCVSVCARRRNLRRRCVLVCARRQILRRHCVSACARHRNLRRHCVLVCVRHRNLRRRCVLVCARRQTLHRHCVWACARPGNPLRRCVLVFFPDGHGFRFSFLLSVLGVNFSGRFF